MNAKRNLIPFSPFSPFVLFFLSHYFTFPYLFLFFFISCALSLLLLSYRDKKPQCLFCRSSQKKRDHFFPRVQGKSHKITHISSSSLIFRALLFLFAQCMRLHLVFSPQVIISVEGAFTAQNSSAGAHQHHHHSLLCSPASAADSGKTPGRKENLQY